MTAAVASAGRSSAWWVLVRLEWRLTIRAMLAPRVRTDGKRGARARWTGRGRIAFWVIAVLLFHALGVGLALVLPRHLVDAPTTRLAAVLVLGFLFTMMLSSAMSRVVAAFHERRDLELLLAAPIPPAAILVVRALSVTAAVSLTFALFLYPVADAGIAMGRWWIGLVYPPVPLMALLATAVALTLTGAVVRAIGVRRARVGLQIFSALVGASFYLVSQARQFLPHDVSTWVTARLMRLTQDDRPPWPIGFATRLAIGDAVTWLVFTVACVGLFALSVRLASRRFFEVAQTPEADGPTTAATTAPARAAVGARIASGFAHGLFATLLVKEWRLILRAPQLISQVLLQLLYLMPLMFVAFGRGSGDVTWSGAAFAAGVVGVTSTLATSLAWLTVSAEDAPDLLAGSPKGQPLIVAAKLVAATLPPALLLAAVAIGAARRSVADATIVFVLGLLACISAAILSAATPSSAKRSDFQRRHRGRGTMALIEMFQFLIWAVAAGLAVQGLWIFAAAATAGALITPAFYLPRALRRVGADGR